MKIELNSISPWFGAVDKYSLDFSISARNKGMTLDQIEDLEINLTDIIKQLQDYRLAQICGDE
jgi:hypothetical protein